jgi:DNA polymerase-1
MSQQKRKTLVLLDSHAIIHRAYHALPDFASSKGVPTGALYGLTTMLLGILEKFKPEYVVACYDLPDPTYRHLAYDGYKAGRKKTDENLVEQLISSRKIFEAFGVPIFDHPGFEADDMLGTIVEQVTHIGGAKDIDGSKVKIVIASGDMDTMQLVTGDDVVVYTLKKGIKDIVVYDELAVIERFGFAPKYLPDYKGLRGDPSDNIIGIAGIGEKTATILIDTFKTVENMYQELEADPVTFKAKLKSVKITDRIAELIEKGKDDAIFSKTLATIRRDAPITFNFEDVKWTPHIDQIDALCKELEFRTLPAKVKQVLGLTPAGTTPSVSGKKGGDTTSGEIEEGGMRGEENQNQESVHQYADVPLELQEKLKVALWVVNSNLTNPSLDDVFAETGISNAESAYTVLWKKAHDAGLGFILDHIETPLVPLIIAMRTYGVRVDIKYLRELGAEYHSVLETLEKEIHALAGVEFNIASPKQLGEILYDKLGLGGAGSGKRIKKTAGGARSTKESELEKLVDAHPIVSKIMEYRELAKLLGTYIDVFPALVDDKNRLHATFTQTGTTTGRMSSENPNLQNIPIKSELGKRIRHAFIASTGKKLVAIDYSQIELRFAAILSGDKHLIDIFKNGIDVHTGVASRVFKVSESEVTKDMRRQAKVINFGILYGMGVTALRQNLAQGGTDISREEAQQFYNEYFNTFTGIASYLEETKKSAAVLGYTKTIFGRRRYFEGLKSKLPFIRAAAERMAINAPIQGSNADITKLAMRYVQEYVDQKGYTDKCQILMQIHDEIVFEIDASMADTLSKEIAEVMRGTLQKAFVAYKEYFYGEHKATDELEGSEPNNISEIEKRLADVPLEVSVSVGNSWGDMK